MSQMHVAGASAAQQDKMAILSLLVNSFLRPYHTQNIDSTIAMTTKARLQSRTWERDSFVISTNPNYISIPKLRSVFESDTFYWADTLPAEMMQEMLDNSLSFGLYSKAPSIPAHADDLIGFARCITDFTTFAYLTDVFVDPTLQGKGLGTWLMQCVDEAVEEIPHLRRTVLFTGDWGRSVPFYRRVMGMELFEITEGKGLAIMEKRGKCHPESLKQARKQ
jgi:GNAT superfamily N-acetyltransferase